MATLSLVARGIAVWKCTKPQPLAAVRTTFLGLYPFTVFSQLSDVNARDSHNRLYKWPSTAYMIRLVPPINQHCAWRG